MHGSVEQGWEPVFQHILHSIHVIYRRATPILSKMPSRLQYGRVKRITDLFDDRADCMHSSASSARPNRQPESLRDVLQWVAERGRRGCSNVFKVPEDEYREGDGAGTSSAGKRILIDGQQRVTALMVLRRRVVGS